MSKKCTVVLLLWLIAISGVGQPSLDQTILAYEKFQATGRHPNIRLILNQSKFSPGDTILYKAYLLDQHNLPVAGRNLFRLYVTNFRGKLVAETIFAVVDGRGFNQLQLPDSLAAGLYLLTVENPWLRKATPSGVYHHEIAVVHENEITRQEIKAFVEGGSLSLIPSFPNKVVFQGPGNALILLENSKGETLDTCLTDDFGLGHVILNPADTQSYFAKGPFQNLRLEIPVGAQGQYGLHLRRSPTDGVILVDLKYAGNLDRNKIFAVVTGQGSLRYTATIEPSADGNVLSIPMESLSVGMNTFSLLSQGGQVLAFRNFYHHSLVTPKAEILPAQSLYQSRQEAHFDISVKDEFGNPAESEFTFWAVNGNVLNPVDMIFALTGLNIPIPAATGSDHSRLFSESLDDYCVTQRRDPAWEPVLRTSRSSSDSHQSVFYRKGRVYINESNEPAPDNTQVLFYFQKTGLHYQTVTLNGRIQITIPEFYGEEKLFYMAESPDGNLASPVKIEWDTETHKHASSAPSIELTIKDEYGQFASKLKSIQQSYQHFFDAGGGSDITRTASVGTRPGINFDDKVAGADVEVNLKEYQSFSTLREVIKELIPTLKFRLRQNRPTIRVDLKGAVAAKGDPLFIIDGFPTQRAEWFLALQPGDIKYIGIIRSEPKLRKLGLMGKNGVVIVETNNTNLHRQLNQNLEVIKGISPVFRVRDTDRPFNVNPKYPIFRSTLCWIPAVTTDSEGKASITFHTTDDTGPVYIFIVGFTKEGKPVFACKKIVVNAGN